MASKRLIAKSELPIMPAAVAAREQFAARELTAQEVIDLRHGKRIAANGATAQEIAGVHEQQLIAMLEPVGAQLKSSVVFAAGADD